MGITSMVFSQSEILKEEVYLFESIDSIEREDMLYLNAVVFVRPTKRNLDLLKKEVRQPNYKDYYICLSWDVIDF